MNFFDSGGTLVAAIYLAVSLGWLVGGDDLTGALHVLQLQLTPPPPSPLAPIKFRMETFWYQLTQVHLENDR